MWNRFKQWVIAPTFDANDDVNRSAALLNTILWIFIMASSLYGLLAPVDAVMRWRRAVIIIPFVLALLGLKELVNRGYVRVVGWLVVFSLWLMFTTAMAFGADYKNPAYMGYLIVVICAGLTLNWRAAIGWSIFSVITNAFILYWGQNGTLPLSNGATPPAAFWTAQTVYIIVASFLISQSLRKIDQAFANAQHEINMRKRMEVEREKVIKELELKNTELERFTYTVSHDLKSPLITIGGFLGFLEKDVREGNLDRFGQDIDHVRQAAIKMQALLNDLLELSRIGRLMNPPQEISFETIVREAIALVDGRLLSNNVEVKIQKDLPNVYGDRIRLLEVMQNLLDNAAKFSSQHKPAVIEVGFDIQDKQPVFFVKDNGIGFDPAHKDRIFGLFNKLNTNSEGTGIGLALVKRTIEVHGGRIWVDSKENEGTTFFFTLAAKPNEI